MFTLQSKFQVNIAPQVPAKTLESEQLAVCDLVFIGTLWRVLSDIVSGRHVVQEIEKDLRNILDVETQLQRIGSQDRWF